MPELPEVETVRRGLFDLIVGLEFSSVEALWHKSLLATDADAQTFLLGSKVVDVRRRAKLLIIELDSGYALAVHLKMTGQLVYRGEQHFGAGHPNDSLIGELPDRSTRVVFTFSDGSKLYFNDQRKFGWVRLLPIAAIDEMEFVKKLGPEPLESVFTPHIFIDRIRRRANTTIKAALLDQTVLAGVGNIYADESLWAAKIHPSTRVYAVTDSELTKLHSELVDVLNLSIEKGGSTDRNYVNAEGKKGSYIDFARVFRREGLDCPRCGTTIIKIRVAGRGTHICETCQVFVG